MTLSEKYNAAKACLSPKETTEIARKFRCKTYNINKFKVDLITFIKDYHLETARVHFSEEVCVREIPRRSKRTSKKKVTTPTPNST